MARLTYLDEEHARFLIGLTQDLFPDAPAFELRQPEGQGLLSSALAVPHQPNYRTLPRKAAALHYHLSMNHPFFDGNKRFAVAAMEAFIVLNGASLMTTDQWLVDTSLGVANHEMTKLDLTRLIERRTMRLDWSESRLTRWATSLSPTDEPDVVDTVLRDFSEDDSLRRRIYEALIRQYEALGGVVPVPGVR